MDTTYRIVGGELAPDELAALTLALMACTARTESDGAQQHQAHYRQRSNPTCRCGAGRFNGYRTPVSWQ